MKKCLYLFDLHFIPLNYRIHEVNKKAQELAQLALDLQKQREQRESENHEPPTNIIYQEEINQRLRELAELAKCGSLDIAIKLATDSF